MAIIQPDMGNNKRKQWTVFVEDILVTVKRIETSEHIRVRMNTMHTVGDLKDSIKERWGDERSKQKFISGREVLAKEGNTLGLHGIGNMPIIHLA